MATGEVALPIRRRRRVKRISEASSLRIEVDHEQDRSMSRLEVQASVTCEIVMLSLQICFEV